MLQFAFGQFYLDYYKIHEAFETEKLNDSSGSTTKKVKWFLQNRTPYLMVNSRLALRSISSDVEEFHISCQAEIERKRYYLFMGYRNSILLVDFQKGGGLNNVPKFLGPFWKCNAYFPKFDRAALSTSIENLISKELLSKFNISILIPLSISLLTSNFPFLPSDLWKFGWQISAHLWIAWIRWRNSLPWNLDFRCCKELYVLPNFD